MKKLLTILILLLFSAFAKSQEVATVEFKNNNESDVINYVLQYQDHGWQDVKTINKGSDYYFEIPFRAGSYRLLVHQKSSDYYTKVVKLSADEMVLTVEVNSQIILHVSSPKRQQAKIILYDVTARTIFEKEVGLNSDENTIYLEKPAAGIYAVKIIGDQSSVVQKIFIR